MMENIKLERLNRNEIYRYLGYKNIKPSPEIEGIINSCEDDVLKIAKPRYLYGIFDIEESFNENGEYKGVAVLKTSLVLEGNSIREHLEGCKKAVLLAATLSSDIDRLIIKAQKTKDMAYSFILDTVSSVAIEQVCQTFDTMLSKELPEYYQTFRFGIGYGDLPLYHEKTFLNILNAEKRIGLCSNQSDILTPRKSVISITGLSTEPISNKKRGCATCNMAGRCSFRLSGTTCNM